jgi:hypothetical protein
MKGYIEHDGRTCLLGEHSNRGTTRDMCPIFLALRRTRLKETMQRRRNEAFWERLR